jgi:hypothetical protein
MKMSSGNRRAALFQNLAMLASSVFLSLLLAEVVLFRVLFPGADQPAYDFSPDGIVKHLPNQSGTYRIKNEIAAPFRINQNGWNSAHERYVREKGRRSRIAVIGDSYVEALQVPYDASLAERIEGFCGGRCEAYRFGISGAPLSQYWHVLRREAASYDPDWAVVIVVQNDFDESFMYGERQRQSAFLKLRMAGDRVTGEIEPSPPFVPWHEPLKKLGIYRSLWIRFQLRAALVAPVGLNNPATVDDLSGQLDAMREAARYVVKEMRDFSSQHRIRLLFVMDGDRMAIYNGEAGVAPGQTKGWGALRAMMREVTREAAVDLLDLHEVFAVDYRLNRRAFNFANDFHWNEHGHELVAQVIYRHIADLENGRQSSEH